MVNNDGRTTRELEQDLQKQQSGLDYLEKDEAEWPAEARANVTGECRDCGGQLIGERETGLCTGCYNQRIKAAGWDPYDVVNSSDAPSIEEIGRLDEERELITDEYGGVVRWRYAGMDSWYVIRNRADDFGGDVEDELEP